MNDDRYLLAGSGVAILAGVALLASSGALGALVPFGGHSMTDSGLAGFSATSPHCADAPAPNASVTARQVAGGTQVHVERTVEVPARSTDVNADLRSVGPHRYVLAVRRASHATGRGASCDLVVRYNATVNVTHAARFTVVLTHDDRLRAVYWSTPDTDGVVRRGGPNGSGGARTAVGTPAPSRVGPAVARGER